jgi:hypothetical protein
VCADGFIIFLLPAGWARFLWFFPMYSYVSEDKFYKILFTYMEQFSLDSQFKEAFPFPLGSRFFQNEMTKLQLFITSLSIQGIMCRFFV